MAKLTEYLSGLVTSINNARVLADHQTIMIAESYNKDKLLRNFPVPRLRIGDVEVTVPVAPEELIEKTITVLEPLDRGKIKEAVINSIKELIPTKFISKDFDEGAAKGLDSMIELLENDAAKDGIEVGITKFAERFTELSKRLNEDNSSKSKESSGKIINPSAINQSMKTVLEPHLKVKEIRKIIDTVNVVMESHKLREYKPETLIYIKLRITEDAVEWSRSENAKGKIEEILIPE